MEGRQNQYVFLETVILLRFYCSIEDIKQTINLNLFILNLFTR